MSAPLLEHSADGIQELDNPLPRWWLMMFYVCVAFSVVYCALYPSLPTWPGLRGWSQQKQWSDSPAPRKSEPGMFDLAALAAQPATLDTGKKLFSNNCVACHGLKAEGKIGPCLTDTAWRYGNTDKDLLTTIRKGRPKGMPAWGTFLKPDEVGAVACYIHSIGNTTVTAPGAH